MLVAMSGGVDSSVAASLLCDQGYDVVGATMKLWGGRSDTGCCSAADVEDARRVAAGLSIPHHVFNFADTFEESVVGPYVRAHAVGQTPNPCIECNRRVKFDRFLERAITLGFDAIATGHYARVVRGDSSRAAADSDSAVDRDRGWSARSGEHSRGYEAGPPRLFRARDSAKDQSYVLSMLTRRELERLVLPLGSLTKSAVREYAEARSIRTAHKADSQDVCFIASRGSKRARKVFLAERMVLHEGRVIAAETGAELGRIDAVELVTVGQRRGLGVAVAKPAGRPHYALRVDVAARTVTVGTSDDLASLGIRLTGLTTTSGAAIACGTEVSVQTSAHGRTRPAVVTDYGVAYRSVQPRVAPGQTVALYVGEEVVGSGIALGEPEELGGHH